MVKLYQFSTIKNNWIFVGYGLKKYAELYAERGFIVLYV